MSNDVTVPWNPDSEKEIADFNASIIIDCINRKVRSMSGLLIYKVMPVYRWSENRRTMKWKDPVLDQNGKVLGYKEKTSEIVGRIPTGIIGERRKCKYGTETIMYDRPKKVPIDIKKTYFRN
jgi:hypothetical protein